MKVGILTLEQKESLIGQLVQVDWYFNPVQDCNDNWIISTEEIDNSIYPQNEWVKELSLIDWCNPYNPTPSGSTENYVGS
jgi:hypothetical protein